MRRSISSPGGNFRSPLRLLGALFAAALLLPPGPSGAAVFGQDGEGVVEQAGVARPDSATLAGRVTEEIGDRPVRGALVLLPPTERSVVTDSEGRFVIGGLSPGSYTLRIEALGYRSLEMEVEVGPDGTGIEAALVRHPLGLPDVIATGTPLRGVAPYQPGQAFGVRELAVRAGNSFGEMLDGEPGLAMRSFGPAAGRPVIRGLDGDRVAVLEGGQRTGDMSETAHDHAVAMEPLLAERVEVIRGPASLLYGSSALGGVVNLLRRDIPTDWADGLTGALSAQGATVNDLVAAAGTAVYGSDRWAATARASFRDGGDFRAPGSPGGVLESTHSRLATGAAGVGWAGERFRGGFALDLHDHAYGVPEELDDPDERIEIRSERRRLTGLADWTRPDAFLERVELRVAAARFLQREVESERRPDGSVLEEIPHHFRRLTADATLTAAHGTLGPFREGAVGLSFIGSDLSASGIEEFHPDGRNLSVALFAFEQIPLTERLAFQTGIRLERGWTHAFANEAFPGFSARRRAATLSGAVGLHARPAEGVEVGAQLGRAHRSPRLDQLYSDGPHIGAARFEIGDPDLRNEVGHGFDLFARYAGGRLHGEVALFHMRIRDYVFPRHSGESDAGTGLPVVQWTATQASFSGGEAALEALPLPSLRVRLTADYVRAVQRDAARTPLPFIPPLRGSLRATFDPGGWWIGARTRLAGRQDHVPPSQAPTDGYALLDLQAGLRIGGPDRTVVLRLDNALDAVYRDHLSRVDERRFPMPGRNLTLVYRWGF